MALQYEIAVATSQISVLNKMHSHSECIWSRLMAINAASLRAFHAVAETGQFTAAARVLSLTQSTLSNQVAALESRYHVRLFDRTPKGA
jgi:hypothetical protein